MPALSLPLSFTNSFWSQDYRKGLEVVYSKLEQGIAENDEIVTFIRARIAAETALAASLTNPSLTGPRGTGFDADDGASLLMAFRGLQAESIAQGTAHKAVAKELETLVAGPFGEWAQGHKGRVRSSKASLVDGWLKAYEQAQGEVSKLKHQYLTKTQRADEAEDDAKFAPNSDYGDKYTSSPKLSPRDVRQPQRTASVSERIAQRLKDIQRRSSPKAETAGEEKLSPSIDKGKAREVDESISMTASPPSLSPPLPPTNLNVPLSISSMPAAIPPPILLAGLALPPAAVSALLTRAASELPLRPIRFPLLGEYKDCFSGQEFADWLLENVPGLGGSWDKADDAAKDLTEREGLLRRVGELGNHFEYADDAFYQFRPKAFDVLGDNLKSPDTYMGSPKGPAAGLAPVADNLFKTSTSFANLVTKALNSNSSSEPLYVRARMAAEEADRNYRVAVRKLDRQRLGLEERIEDALKTLQRCEADRLRAVKTVLLQYQGTLSTLPKALEPSFERSSTLIASFQPESDLTALIERYRTGPFRPEAHVYESVAHDEADVVFGIDLRKWAEGGWSTVISGEEKKVLIPSVVTSLLAALTAAYPKLPTDAERRKAWIYDVPLTVVHHLRESLNAVPPEKPIPAELLAKYDAPVLASALKLWALELDPPLGLYEGWEDFRKIYPTMGATKAEREAGGDQQRIQDLQSALLRLPKVHLLVLNAIIEHIKILIDTTEVDESKEVYTTKLALSMGRSILRPKFESHLSIQDRHPTLLFIDLVQHYEEILPPTISRKKRESDRRMPVRKRTAPIDMRLSRSKIPADTDAMSLLNAQRAALNHPPPVPPLPVREPGAGFDQKLPAPPPVETLPEAAPPTLPVVPESVVPEKAPAPELPVVPEAAPPVPTTTAEDLEAPPPRPKFREPPPEDDTAPPMPKFADPPPETEDVIPSSGVVVASPTPESKPQTPEPPPTILAQSRRASQSLSPTSPLSDDQTLTNTTSLSRSSSGEASRVRGPRATRTRPASGNVSNLVSTLNRAARAASPPSSRPGHVSRLSNSSVRPANPSDYEPKKKGVGRASAGLFSRRTVASDAEDEVVGK